MSYDCLRNWNDEVYHATCLHDCCGDKECEKRNHRWWGKARYDNGVRISPNDNGIYTTSDLENLKKWELPYPTHMYSLNGVRVYSDTDVRVVAPKVARAVIAQGMARPWSHVALCFIVLSFVCGVVQ